MSDFDVAESPAETRLDSLPPECPDARECIRLARDAVRQASEIGFAAEDAVGCVLWSNYLIRADYHAPGALQTAHASRVAAMCVFRDAWAHGRDLLALAGWLPAIWVPGQLSVAFGRFVAWRARLLAALGIRVPEPEQSRRSREILALWTLCEHGAARAGRVDVRLMRGDILRAMTEAGLRGESGLDSVSAGDVASEMELVFLTARRASQPLMYRDDRGRARISSRRAAAIHPNRGQRMPPTKLRRRLGQTLRGNAETATTGEGSEELRQFLEANTARRVLADAEAARRAREDAEIDRDEACARLREQARRAGPPAVAALTYLLWKVARIGERITRRQACSLVSPPVTVERLRYQEIWLLPLVKEFAATM